MIGIHDTPGTRAKDDIPRPETYRLSSSLRCSFVGFVPCAPVTHIAVVAGGGLTVVVLAFKGAQTQRASRTLPDVLGRLRLSKAGARKRSTELTRAKRNSNTGNSTRMCHRRRSPASNNAWLPLHPLAPLNSNDLREHWGVLAYLDSVASTSLVANFGRNKFFFFGFMSCII